MRGYETPEGRESVILTRIAKALERIADAEEERNRIEKDRVCIEIGKDESFDLPDEMPLGKPTAEDIVQSTLEHVPDGVPPDEWKRAVEEFLARGVTLAKDGTLKEAKE